MLIVVGTCSAAEADSTARRSRSGAARAREIADGFVRNFDCEKDKPRTPE